MKSEVVWNNNELPLVTMNYIIRSITLGSFRMTE